MNFDVIEGLSEEELLNLYENGIVDGLEDGTINAYCTCTIGYMHGAFFGIHDKSDSNNTNTYCGLQLTDASRCGAWCSRHGFSYYYVNSGCTCRTYGRFHEWSTCSR